MHDLQLLVYNHGFELQDSVCNGCYDLTMLSVNTSDIAIITVKNVDFCCIIHNISKPEAINLLKNFLHEDCGYIYKMVDSEYSISICKYLNINIGTVMRNPEMLKFVPDHLKTKKLFDHAVKKIVFSNKICS